MSTETKALIGAGGHAAVVADAAIRARLSDLAVYSEEAGEAGTAFLEFTVQFLSSATVLGLFHICIGNNRVRERLHRELLARGGRPFTVIHPHSTIAAGARLEGGVFVAAGAVVAPRCSIGHSTIINHRSIVDHDVRVGSATHIAPGAILGGGARIGDRVLVGAGATILPGVHVHDDAVIGAGSVVLQDVPAAVTVVGIPARSKTRGITW